MALNGHLDLVRHGWVEGWVWDDERPTEPLTVFVSLNGKEVARADELFHRTLVALAGNREMLRTFDQLTERIRIIRRLDFINPQRIAAAFDEHAKILEKLLARKADSAEMLLKAHILASRTEIRHITLHRLALASSQHPAVGSPE